MRILLDFLCSFARIFILSCGIIAVFQNQAVCGTWKFWGNFNVVCSFLCYSVRCLTVFLCGFAVFIPSLHVYIVRLHPSLWHFIKVAFNQVSMVCHTNNWKKNLEESFTLSSELPFLADLVFWLYYIVLQFALLFLLIKIPKYVAQCSPSLEENHIDKN